MSLLRWMTRLLLAASLLSVQPMLPAGGSDWAPIPAEELQLQDSPTHPGFHAIILHREEYTDDIQSFSNFHIRIKVLTEQGRSYANVEIPFDKDDARIHDLKARTVRPDGTSAEFQGAIYEKTVAKARGVKFLAKTFSLPDVQVGTIIEYKYRINWDTNVWPDLHWLIQKELPTRRLALIRKPHPQASLRYIVVRLPRNEYAEKGPDGLIRLEMENVPPLVEEEFMPPASEMNMRVDFFYMRTLIPTSEFWNWVGKVFYEGDDKFIGKYSEIAAEAAAVIQPLDPPETKLRKLYARAQQVRNITYEPSRSEREAKRANPKENKNVKDVLKNGYGNRWQINCLFVALARAAGFDAQPAYLSRRDRYFFDPDFLNPFQVIYATTLVRSGSEKWFLDPGTPFAPFGILPWWVTGGRGLLAGKNGGQFIDSPEPTSEQAAVKRQARLQLLEDGTLTGKLAVTFFGLEALEHRLNAYDEDETGKRKLIEDEVKSWLPKDATLEIVNIGSWQNPEDTFRVECKLTLPGLAISTGRRLLLPAGVFQVGGKHPFQSAKRVNPVYFGRPFQEVDEVTIELPQGFSVESMPPGRQEVANWAGLQTRRTAEGSELRLERRLQINRYYFPPQHYALLRSFYDLVRSADEERVVLQKSPAASAP